MKKLLLTASLAVACSSFASAEVTTVLMDNIDYTAAPGEKLYRMYSDALADENPISTDNFYFEFTAPVSSNATNWQFGTFHMQKNAEGLCSPMPGITITKVTFVCRDSGYKKSTSFDNFTYNEDEDAFVWTGSCSFPDDIAMKTTTQARIMMIKVEYTGTPTSPAMPVVNTDVRALAADDAITLTAPANAKIYYTTNGDDPDNTSTLYTGPITLDETGIVQLRAVSVVGNDYSATLVRPFFVTAAGTKVTTFNFHNLDEYAPLKPVIDPSGAADAKVNFTDTDYIQKDGVTISTAEGCTPPYICNPASLRSSDKSLSYNLFYLGGSMGIDIDVDPDEEIITDVYVMGKTGKANLKFDTAKTPGSIEYILQDLGTRYTADANQPTSKVVFERSSGTAQMETMFVAHKSIKPSGIDAIEVDNTNAPVMYFNLQGMQVNAETLTPGIYIKRQGSKAEKILVK